MLLLEPNMKIKQPINKAIFRSEFDNSKIKSSSEYKIKATCNSAVYTKESEGGQLSSLFYFVL